MFPLPEIPDDPNRPHYRVLVVDDEPTVRLGFALSLTNDSMSADTAANGEEDERGEGELREQGREHQGVAQKQVMGDQHAPDAFRASPATGRGQRRRQGSARDEQPTGEPARHPTPRSLRRRCANTWRKVASIRSSIASRV